MKIKGNKKDNTLVGSEGDDKIQGLGGDDHITAKGGHDTVSGGAGDDVIKIAADTSATIDAGKGNDTVKIGAGALSSTIDLGKGDDSVDFKESSQSNQSFTIDGGKGNDSVNFALGQDAYTITENGDEGYTVVDANGNSYALSSISALTFDGIAYVPPVVQPNQSPVLSTPIADQAATVNNAYSFQVGATAFTDPDNDTLVYTATLSDGSALPSWLAFDATTRTFSGTPTSAGAVTVRVTASDGSLTAFDDFVIGVTAGGGGGGGGGSPFVNSYGDLDSYFGTGELYAGHGNPSDGFAKSVNDAAGIELGLDVRFNQNPTEIDPDVGTNIWHVNGTELNDLRFAYSAAADLGLGNYDVRLSIDTDGSQGEDFFELNLGQDQGGNNFSNNENSKFDWYDNNAQAVITDDGGDAAGTVTQNIQALQWYQQAGLEAGDEFKVKLEAFQQGTNTVLAGTEITIQIEGHTERASEDFNGNSDLVLTNIGVDAYGNVALTGQGTAIVTQTAGGNDGAGPFTRFDDYRTDGPDVVTTSVDVNILAADIGNGEGFEYTVAANTVAGNHLRDFVFHVANNGAGVEVGVSNNAGATPADLTGDPNAVALSDGWYTFQHTMYENASGDLEVELAVIDRDTGATVFTQTLSQATDDFSNFGGNRYGWFAEIDVTEGLEIDNWDLAAQYF